MPKAFNLCCNHGALSGAEMSPPKIGGYNKFQRAITFVLSKVRLNAGSNAGVVTCTAIENFSLV
jgi:hypothetical protein